MTDGLAEGKAERLLGGIGPENVRQWRERITRSVARFVLVMVVVSALAILRDELTERARLLWPLFIPAVIALSWVSFAPRVAHRTSILTIAAGTGATALAAVAQATFWAPNAFVAMIMLVSVLVVIAEARVAWLTLAGLVVGIAGVGTYYVVTNSVPAGELGRLLEQSSVRGARFDPRLGSNWFRVALIFTACGAVSVATISFLTTRLEQALSRGNRLYRELERYSAERINALEREARLEAQLRQAQRLEALGRLSGGIAHDFNNLLVVINNNATFLKERTPQKLHRELDEIEVAGQKAADLVRQLLSFSRQPPQEVIHLELDDGVAAALRLVRRLLPANVRLESELHAGDAHFATSPTVLEQVLLNLCANARDALPDGGTIRVETKRVQRAAPNVADEAAFLCLSVADDGVGMTPEQKERIFDPFFTTKEVGKGTGLGLSVVHGAVAQQGGFIEVESEPQRGSVFRVYFPQATPEQVASRPTTPSPVAKRGETLLVVDDDAGVVRVLRQILVRAGYEVITCTDGNEALQRFEENKEDISLILTDSVMPKMGGKSLHEIITSVQPDLPFLFCSGYTPTVFPDGFFDDSRREWLAKPFRPDQVLSTVRMLLDEARE